jgi:hypothetical protein
MWFERYAPKDAPAGSVLTWIDQEKRRRLAGSFDRERAGKMEFDWWGAVFLFGLSRSAAILSAVEPSEQKAVAATPAE